jgi:hypothetical protein
MIETGSSVGMDTPQARPDSLIVQPKSHSRTSSLAPSYRSRFFEAEIHGDSTTHLPLAGHYNCETGVPYFPTPPKEKGRLFAPSKSHRARSPSLAPFILKSDHGIEAPSIAPRLPNFVRLVLHVIALIASPVIVGLLIHSLQLYTRTRDINFSGTEGSWPTRTGLLPVHFLLVVASISIVTSFLALLQSLRMMSPSSISISDIISISTSSLILVLWVASIAVFERDDKAGKNSLVSWSCDRKHSPGNNLISYGVICGETVCCTPVRLHSRRAHANCLQKAACDTAIVLALAEIFVLITWTATAFSLKKGR